MVNRAVLLSIFPIAFLFALIIERLTQYLIGYFPSHELFWMVSLELRTFFRDLSNIYSSYLYQSMVLQLSVLIGLAGICSLLVKRKMLSSLFLVNHFALLVVVVASLSTSDAVVSANGEEILGNVAYRFGTVDLSLIHVMMITAGIVSCIGAHIIYLMEQSRRASQREAIYLLLKFEA